MAFIIPNAGDTADQKYISLNQAEPDSLDIEALGNMLTSSVRSGGEVTFSGSGTTINIASGVAILNGVPYPFTASSFPAGTVTGTAFTAVVVRLSGTTASVVALNGAESSTNPVLPKSSSTLTGSYNAATDFSPATDVLLATLLRSSSAPTSKSIVDKRVMYSGALTWTQATVPTVSQGNNGDVVTVGTSAYVKASGTWFQASPQVVVDEIMPVGGIMTWPSFKDPTGVGSRWLECKGQSVTATSYPVLANAWGVSGTFTIPNYTGLLLQGATTTGSGIITASGGSATVSVPLKDHSHTLSAHTHTLPAHSHSATVTGTDGGHSHTGNLSNTSVTVQDSGLHTHTVRTSLISPQGIDLWGQVKDSSYGAGGFTVATSNNIPLTSTPVPSDSRLERFTVGGGSSFGDPAFPNTGGPLNAAVAGTHSHTASVTSAGVSIAGAGNHVHSITVAESAAVASEAPSNNATSVVGVVNPEISTLSPFRSVRYFVRAT